MLYKMTLYIYFELVFRHFTRNSFHSKKHLIVNLCQHLVSRMIKVQTFNSTITLLDSKRFTSLLLIDTSKLTSLYKKHLIVYQCQHLVSRKIRMQTFNSTINLQHNKLMTSFVLIDTQKLTSFLQQISKYFHCFYYSAHYIENTIHI